MRPIPLIAITLLLSACATVLPTSGDREVQLEWGNQFASPGARLIYEETFREPTQEGTGVTYKLRAEGFPSDKTYSLWARGIDRRTTEIYKPLHIDGSGRILQDDGAEREYVLKKMLEGESIEIALISSDKSKKAFVEITPFPIIAQGEGNCRLSVKPLSAEGQAFQIKGEGFVPKQELKVVAKSNGELGEFPVNGTDDGVFGIVVAPAVLGKSGGGASVTVADTTCSATVRYKWGDAMGISGLETQQTNPLPPDRFLQDKALEVGRTMGWSLAYENRDEGLFVWRFKEKSQLPELGGNECEGLFTWYIKRVGNNIALDDPVVGIPGCPCCAPDPKQFAAFAKSIQRKFQQRWRALAGPIILIGPTDATHSSKLEGQVIGELIKISTPPEQTLPNK
ncbi:MAG: hypothetical protein LUQ11_14020 [Methylococcaceae bacterium]|nr:hypothetical protein [Methylococcaceae bacterium]